ncbi:hypothetical protein ALC62_15740 [Cyphomyrmex costatus]|uniref:Myb/SANT-like DNA-binding domain-containing protein n=1 Tax=Cyphomyrmex costatus TaxID=456900 RepID=A0A151I6E8_9HYME|nr:hypothetical protein ALC62_15740 [Cyphomyrmex costatus]
MWTDKSRAMLLHLYKKYKCDFDSNIIKKDDVWTKITCDMKCEGYNFSATQCKEKMKYMKKKYFKKIDNMGPKSTGAAPLKCDNFKELDELFGNKPNVIPVAIASSSENDNRSKVMQGEFSDVKDCEKKQRKRASAITLSDLKMILEEKEKTKKAKHEQRQELLRQSITSHERMMDKLLNKFQVARRLLLFRLIYYIATYIYIYIYIKYRIKY